MVSIEEVGVMLDEIAEELPQEFYKKLNGGISLLPETKLSEHNMYIMGEYHCERVLGRYINIYYGSFMRVYGHLSASSLRGKLKETLAHEFTHHLESLGGEFGLEIKDALELRKYLDSQK